MAKPSTPTAPRASVWPAAREELHDVLVAACARADHGLIATGTPKTCGFPLTKQSLLLSPGQRELLLADLEGLAGDRQSRSEEHTSELQSHSDLVCRLLLEKK